jgi:hypothetical protein
MDFGVMVNIANPLDREEREAVANYLGVQRPDAPVPQRAYCADRAVTIDASPNPAWNGWGPDLSNTRYATSSGITLNQVGKLKLKWAYGFDGDVTAFGAAAVLGRTLFVGSAGGAVQALSTDSGCIRWVYQADGPVRAAMSVVPNGKTHVLVVADLIGWAYGLEAESGRLLWKKKPEPHESTKLTGSLWRNCLHPSRFLGRDPRHQSGLPMLHVPRQRDGAASQGRSRGVEDLHHSRHAQANREGRRRNLGSIGRKRLGIADAGCQARPAVRCHRRQFLFTRHRTERLDSGAGFEERTNCVGQTSDARRCVQRRLLGELSRTGLRLRIVRADREAAQWP